jgi:sec-independent protein translocase protein TatA
MGPIGLQEMIAVFLIALLLFGPKKLPELGRTLGKALSEFRRAKNELKSTFESHLHELERETRIDIDEPKYIPPAPDYSSRSYPYPYEDSTYQSPAYESRPESHQISEGTEAAAESLPASPAAIEAAEPPPDYSAAPHERVEGTVARSNGVHPVTPVPLAEEEEHPA